MVAGPTTRCLDEAVSDAFGSFADTLRLAIDHRGLGLDRIRDHLEQRGVSVSVATLSYWRSGRSQPGRRTSLEALPHLEEVLGLDAGALRRTLPVSRDRPRRCAVRGLDVVWPETPQTQVLSCLDTRWDTELDRLGMHDIVRIGPDRRHVSQTVRQVMRARSDGPDRGVVMHCQEDLAAGLPELRAVHGCTVGRFESNEQGGVVGAELVFFRPLRRGETVIVEYDVVAASPGPLESGCTRRLRLPVREYVLEVQFHPDALPQSVVARSEAREALLEPDPSHRVHLVQTDATPGVTGLHWTWPPS